MSLVDPRALSPADVKTMLDELATMFGGKKDLDKKCDLYFRLLAKLPLRAVRAAVDRCLEEPELQYFPKVGRLKAYAKEWLAQQRAAEAPREPTDLEMGLQCGDCRERLATHRVITRSAFGPVIALHTLIRHLDGCSQERAQADRMQLYSQTFADPIPPAGVVHNLEAAWLQTEPIHGPLPATVAQLPSTPQDRRRPDRRKPAVQLATLVPVVGAAIEQGDAFEEEVRHDG